MSISKSANALNNTVISNGYCIGCGACAVPDNSPITIVKDEYGRYQAKLSEASNISRQEVDFESICPFGALAPNEDEIADQYFSDGCQYDAAVGHYKDVFAGHVSEGTYRERGSSGGMGTWLLNELLAEGLVDQVIHVRPDGRGDIPHKLPFRYRISESVDQVCRGGKSRYYPVELSEVLKFVHVNPGRYAIVGLPCFIKSVRLLQAQDPIFATRVRFCVGLVCGHLKSTFYAESLAWQMGIAPSELEAIDFRVKDSSSSASRYSVSAKGKGGEKCAPSAELFGTDWGAGAFKYKACDFCDDVFAETADVVLGDAWLPEYVQDSRGTNLVVTRSAEMHQLIVGARKQGRLKLDQINIQRAAKSQDAGLRHRKVAISFRLYQEAKKGAWTPKKRVDPSPTLTPAFEMNRQRLRTELRDLSHEAFLDAKEKNDLVSYISTMSPVYARYSRISRSLVRRIMMRLKRMVVTALRQKP